ncbi:hypothetical protein H2199_003979 [Coniosporium tulheliwenetii]|uniref:Uncharacterized protein n=1 Tax=Coniosporium tulheliwenetii TaxID=3383036 RepID=A0ACC2Z8J9_9PEZI|nr:hypothetical protein H2199_003979 [Cladosporium sp. JES 115]
MHESVPRQSRDSIKDVWGPRTPYKHEWPTRVDEHVIEEAEKWQSMNSADRLTHPLIRKNGRLERASWDEAMSLVAFKAKDVRERLTSHGIGFYTSGQLFLEEYYVLALVGKGGLNTLHMDGNTRLCTATAAAAMRESFGSDGQPGSYTDIDYTACIFMVGHNMSATQTVLWSRILDRLEGADPPRLIVVDPRLSDSAKKATVHLAPKIGTNMALLNGIQHLMFKNGWINEDYISKHVCNVEDLREKVQSYTPDKVEKITGVPKARLEEAAKIIGTTESLLSTCLQGVYQSNQATASACQINNINLLRGMIGKPGCGIYQMNGQPTAQNNREAGCDGEYPGFRNNNNPEHMKELARLWNIDYEKLPHWSQPMHIQNMLNYIASGTIEMFWISGTNPLVNLPNLPRARELLTKPELFVVCQDIFMTETAAIADVVLPAAQWAEKTGCFTNVDRTVHLSHQAVEPPGEAKSDLAIWVDFAKRMDFRDKDGNPLIPGETPEEIFEAWKRLSKGRPCDYSAMTYGKLTGGSGIQWPCNDDHPNGKERLFDDGHFFTDAEYCESFGHDLETGAPYTKDQYLALNPAGRAILKPSHYIPSEEEPDGDFPLRLSTGRNVYHFHTRTKTGRSRALQEACPEPYIQISNEDAADAGIKDGEEVLVRSRRGAVQLKAQIGKPAKGQVFLPFHFGYWDAKDERARAANELTMERWDPVSKQPRFKDGAVRIEKLPEANGEVQIHTKEQQSPTEKRVAHDKQNAADIGHDTKRERHLELWFGATYDSVELLTEIYASLIPNITNEFEILQGLQILKSIAQSTCEILEPFVEKYTADEQYGKRISHALRDSVFPYGQEEGDTHAYAALAGLLGLQVYLSNIEGHLNALVPASLALWDSQFSDAIGAAMRNIARSQSWVKHQITVRSPQTLVVPSLIERRDV